MALVHSAPDVEEPLLNLVILQMLKKACQGNETGPCSCHLRMEMMDKLGSLL